VPFHLPRDWVETSDMYVPPLIPRTRDPRGKREGVLIRFVGRFSSASTVVAGFAMMSRNSYVPLRIPLPSHPSSTPSIHHSSTHHTNVALSIRSHNTTPHAKHHTAY
jgi:hypothetical protein